MSTTLKAALSAAAAALLMSAPALSAAALAPSELASQSEAVAGARFLEQAVQQALAANLFAAGPSNGEGSWLEHPMAMAQSPLSIKLRGQSDLALWNLVATVHAQQKNQVFDLIDASKKTVWELEKDKVSAVPLPGVVWLFVMGVLGLAGTRVKKVRGEQVTLTPARPLALA